jgi:hypothetical protein
MATSRISRLLQHFQAGSLPSQMHPGLSKAGEPAAPSITMTRIDGARRTSLGKTTVEEVRQAFIASNPVFARYFETSDVSSIDHYCTTFSKHLDKCADAPGAAVLFHARNVYPPNQSLSHAFIAGVERKDDKLEFTWLHQECMPDPRNKGEMIGIYFDTLDTRALFNGESGPVEKAIMQHGLPDAMINPAKAPWKLKEFLALVRDPAITDRYQGKAHRYGHFSTPEKVYVECYGTSNAVLEAMEKGDDFAFGMDVRPLFPSIFVDMAKNPRRLGRTPLDKIRTVSWLDRKTGQIKTRDIEDNMPRDEAKRVLVTVATRSGVTMTGSPWDVEAL